MDDLTKSNQRDVIDLDFMLDPVSDRSEELETKREVTSVAKSKSDQSTTAV